MNIVALLDNLRQDLHYALRTMRNNSAFTLAAVLTLALGIGANTAIFTVVHAVLLKPLAYPEPERLVRVTGGATAVRFEAIRQAQSFTGTAAATVYTVNLTLAGVDGPEALKGLIVSTEFFDVLGVNPLQGRGFLPNEEQPGENVALISSGLWQRKFAADPQIAGAAAKLAGESFTIAGVMPPGIQFPFPDIDVWIPLQPAQMPEQQRLNSPILSVFGRLKPGVTAAEASAEVAVINEQYAQANPGKLDAKPNQSSAVTPLQDDLVKNVRPMLWMLFGAVSLVLLIACANVASLLLARTAARSREFAVRAAIGAGRGRLIAQLLTESLLLAVAGGALGVLLARWSLQGIVAMPGLELPRIEEIQISGPVLVFAIALALVTTLLFGLIPSLSSSRPDLARAMKPGASFAASRSQSWLNPRSLLVVGQLALSIVLLIGAALLMESLARLRQVDPGFQPQNLLSMQIQLPQSKHDELVQRVESIPGVESAAVTLTLPMTGWAGTPVQASGAPPLALNERPIAILQSITPGYFRTLAIPLQRGRNFGPLDTPSSPLVAIISERLARRFWPLYPNGEDPVGKSIIQGSSPQELRIVGIVADIHQNGLASGADMSIYRPRAQTPNFSAMFAVRTAGDPLRFVNAIRGQVAAIDPNQTITAVKTMSDIVEGSEQQRQSILILLGSFASAGLLLAMIGIYGVIAYSVAQRAKEVGIRRSLGAQNQDILRLILAKGLALAMTGAALGVAAAVALTRLLQSLLFEISATDPATFLAVTLLLVCAALLASYLPARRAVRLEPSEVLRSE